VFVFEKNPHAALRDLDGNAVAQDERCGSPPYSAMWSESQRIAFAHSTVIIPVSNKRLRLAEHHRLIAASPAAAMDPNEHRAVLTLRRCVNGWRSKAAEQQEIACACSTVIQRNSVEQAAPQ